MDRPQSPVGAEQERIRKVLGAVGRGGQEIGIVLHRIHPLGVTEKQERPAPIAIAVVNLPLVLQEVAPGIPGLPVVRADAHDQQAVFLG